jgi:hypothetical protein
MEAEQTEEDVQMEDVQIKTTTTRITRASVKRSNTTISSSNVRVTRRRSIKILDNLNSTTSAIESISEKTILTRSRSLRIAKGLYVAKLYPSVSDSDTIEDASPFPKIDWANNHELWRVMREKDSLYIRDPTYLKSKKLKGIEHHMRGILFEWLAEICHAYRFHRETFHLAIEFIDRFLSLNENEFGVDRLQLMGLCALYLASKVEEIYPPKLSDFASHMFDYSNNNEDCMQKFEILILKTIKWKISPCTCNTWLTTYLQLAILKHKKLIKAIENKEMVNPEALNSNEEIVKVHTVKILLPFHTHLIENQTHKTSDTTKKSERQASKSTTNLNIGSLILEKFYKESFMKCSAVVDLCLFVAGSLNFKYSIIAASAMYHMLLYTKYKDMSAKVSLNQEKLVSFLVEKCTGYKINELSECIDWMMPFVQAFHEEYDYDSICKINDYRGIDKNDWHNIQVLLPYKKLLVCVFIQFKVSKLKEATKYTQSFFKPFEAFQFYYLNSDL